MTASRLAWVTALASGLIVAGLAFSATGFFSLSAPGAHADAKDPGGAWGAGGWTNGSYNVTFVETGLPSGTFWSVSLHGWAQHWADAGSYLALSPLEWGGYRWNGSSNSSLGFYAHNGTYWFSVGETRNGTTAYVATPSYGNFTVNGTSVSISISFAPIVLFNVTFSETGLPTGTFWSVGLFSGGPGGNWDQCGGPGGYGSFEWNGTTNASLNFWEPDGFYGFGVSPAWSNGTLFVASPDFGNVTVNGSSVSVAISFAPLTVYNVTFAESGLPTGTNWSVGLSGGYGPAGWNQSANSTINFTRPDGPYYFGIGPVWNSTGVFIASPNWGNVTVDGTDVTVDVTFSFTPGTAWDVALLR